jgi:hypothetical protein
MRTCPLIAAAILIAFVAAAPNDGGAATTRCRPNGLGRTLCTTDDGGRYSLHTHCRTSRSGTVTCRQNLWDNDTPRHYHIGNCRGVDANGDPIRNDIVGFGRDRDIETATRRAKVRNTPACFEAERRNHARRVAAWEKCLAENNQNRSICGEGVYVEPPPRTVVAGSWRRCVDYNNGLTEACRDLE